MTPQDWGRLGWLALTALVVTALAMAATAAWSRRLRRVAVVDVAWGATFAAVAVVGALVAGLLAGEGTAWRRSLLAALVAVWGVRLAWHLRRRVLDSGHDDPRYEELLGGPYGEVPFSRIVAKVFALQGVAILVVSLPVLVGLAAPGRRSVPLATLRITPSGTPETATITPRLIPASSSIRGREERAPTHHAAPPSSARTPRTHRTRPGRDPVSRAAPHTTSSLLTSQAPNRTSPGCRGAGGCDPVRVVSRPRTGGWCLATRSGRRW